MKDDISEELQSHVDMHTADNVRAGMTPGEARRQALIALGGIEQVKETYRERRRLRWLGEFVQDIRFSSRLLLKDRAFTMTAVLVLALGIGANAAIFSVVDALMFTPLPYRDPDRLVMIWEEASQTGFAKNTPAPGNYHTWRDNNRTFSAMAATRSATANLTVDGPPELVLGRRVTANFFEVLGVAPLLGRTFTEEEDRTGERVTVIGHGLWQSRYDGDRAVIGKPIVMNGQRHTIIGVMPRTFVFRNRDMQFWIPINFTPEQRTLRTNHFLNVVGRVAPATSIDDARSDIAHISAELSREFPRELQGSVVEPLRVDLLGGRREQLIVLMAASVCVLLIASANVAGLLLLRAFNRRGEMSVRASLGATNGRIVRQLMAESVILALAGATLGLVLAPAGTRILADMVPMGMFPLEASPIGVRLGAVTLTLAALAAMGFSIGPAVVVSRAPLAESLKQAGRSRMTSAHLSREVLVVSQIAVAVVLLVGTGLLLRTFVNLRGSELGFRPEQLLTVRTTLPVAKYTKHADRVAFFDRVIEEVRRLPGVEDAAYVSTLPFASVGNTSGFLIEGGNPSQRQDALVRIGTVDYLRTIGAELIDGRLLDSRDLENTPGVIVINETFARLHWPGRSAVGRRLGTDAAGMRTIVGVVRDIRERGYEPETRPGVYLANTQATGTTFLPETLVVRAAGDLHSLVAPIRSAVAKADPEQPISAVRTMEEAVDLSVADRRQQATVLSTFTSIAVLLAALGLYAVVAYGVAQRRQEIAVRMAIGASASSVVREVAWSGQKLVLTGLAIGLSGAWATSRMMDSLLRGVTPTDPFTFGAAGASIWAAALLACLVPALRASRISPSGLLRGD